MKKLLVMLCVMLSITFTSFASDWYWVGTDAVGDQWYIDNSSVYNHELTTSEIQGNAVLAQNGLQALYYPYKVVWVKINKPDGSSINQRLKVIKNQKMALLSYVEYDRNGFVENSDTFQYPQESEIVPDTVSEAIYSLVY